MDLTLLSPRGYYSLAMFRGHLWRCLLATLPAVLLLAGCPQGTGTRLGTGLQPPAPLQYDKSASGRELNVWADKALEPALTALAPAFTKATGGKYKLTAIERG